MKAIPYKSQGGKNLFKPALSERRMESIMFAETGTGWCLACGQEVDGVEPDARRYVCECCGQKTVYGMEELLQMNLLVIE